MLFEYRLLSARASNCSDSLLFASRNLDLSSSLLHNIFARRAVLDETDMKGARVDSDDGIDGKQKGKDSRKYSHVVRCFDIATLEYSNTLHNIVENVFDGLVTKFVMESKLAENSDCESKIEELKELQLLYFVEEKAQSE